MWMYKISAGIGSDDEYESRTDLCHPAFAMVGVLSWQVKKINGKKEEFFGFRGRKTAWVFFFYKAQGLPPSLSGAVSCFIFSAFIFCSRLHHHNRIYLSISSSKMIHGSICNPILGDSTKGSMSFAILMTCSFGRTWWGL